MIVQRPAAPRRIWKAGSACAGGYSCLATASPWFARLCCRRVGLRIGSFKHAVFALAGTREPSGSGSTKKLCGYQQVETAKATRRRGYR